MKNYTKIPVLYMRGGTSKGAYLDLRDLPQDKEARDRLILDLYGSPDARQINGIGGADPLTSKVALLEPSKEEGIDIEYTFGYVGIDTASIDYEGNCGNISSGVGIYAILRGMVEPTDGITIVKIRNTNTNKIIEAHIPTKDGMPVIDGDFAIDGVPGTGAKIVLYFLSPGGSKTGSLLPTGNAKDSITLVDGRTIEVSLVDAANPAIFVKASDIGFDGRELPSDDRMTELLAILEDIRTTGAVLMGLAETKETASGAVPKVCMVSTARDYTTSDGRQIEESHIDIVARTKALAVLHKAYAVTGGICTATAALIEGTVAHDVVSEEAKSTRSVRLGHPTGVLEFAIDLEGSCLQSENAISWTLHKAGVARTARPIMDGFAWVKK